MKTRPRPPNVTMIEMMHHPGRCFVYLHGPFGPGELVTAPVS